MIVLNGIERVVGKHNKHIANKRLIVINEMASTREECKSDFDRIKPYITDETITIEPKSIDSYEIDNIANTMCFSNHRDSILVE